MKMRAISRAVDKKLQVNNNLKTFCSLYCASKLKQKTLILVDMTLLMDQFIESILKFTDVK